MRYLLFIFFPFLSFSQDINIELSNNNLIEFNSMETKSICFNIKNNSSKNYKILLDRNGFSSVANEYVDAPYVGLPNFRIYKGKSLLKSTAGSYGYQLSPIANDSIKAEDLISFKNENKINSTDLTELKISYEIHKRVITLRPKEIKSVCMNVSLPIYNSSVDYGSLFYDLKDGEKYYFQIFLPIPKNILKKYFKKTETNSNNTKFFSGSISSNRIPFIYREKP